MITTTSGVSDAPMGVMRDQLRRMVLDPSALHRYLDSLEENYREYASDIYYGFNNTWHREVGIGNGKEYMVGVNSDGLSVLIANHYLDSKRKPGKKGRQQQAAHRRRLIEDTNYLNKCGFEMEELQMELNRIIHESEENSREFRDENGDSEVHEVEADYIRPIMDGNFWTVDEDTETEESELHMGDAIRYASQQLI